MEPLIKAVTRDDLEAARLELADLGKSSASELEKVAARKLVAALEQKPKPLSARAPPEFNQLPLGDAQKPQRQGLK